MNVPNGAHHYQSPPALNRPPLQEPRYYDHDYNHGHFTYGDTSSQQGRNYSPLVGARQYHHQEENTYSQSEARFYLQPSQGEPTPYSTYNPPHPDSNTSHSDFHTPHPNSYAAHPVRDPPPRHDYPEYTPSSTAVDLPPPVYHPELSPPVYHPELSPPVYHPELSPPLPPRNRSSPNSSINSTHLSSNLGRMSPISSGPPPPSQRSQQQSFKSMSQGSRSLDYQNIFIDKERQLGSGAYGAVYHANCDQLACAAKVMHRALSAPGNLGVETARERFQLEIELLSGIRHPNIVQYLTTTLEPTTGNPVLLMELCDENLTHYLERSEPPYHEQLNICVDISLALAHLHLNNLLHRDLTSNNVLMSRGKAKITDFGMSKLAEFQPNTLCPGNPVYMPPEALNEPPKYTDKLDVFSFGVLMVQIMTQKFPEPSNRFRPESSSDRQVFVPVPEVERRKNHLLLIEKSNTLRPVAERCLADKEVLRPSSEDLSLKLNAMKTKPNFTQSLNLVRRVKTESHVGQHDRTRELEQHNHALQMKLEQASIQIENLQGTRDTLAHTREQLRQEKHKYEQKTKECEKLKAAANDQEEFLAMFQKTNEEVAAEKKRLEAEMRELEQRLKLAEMKVEERDRTIRDQEEQILYLKKMGGGGSGDVGAYTTAGVGMEDAGLRDLRTLHWTVAERAPVELSAGSAVTIGDDVYVASDNSKTVYCYDSRGKWTALPDCYSTAFSLTAIDGKLVAVGGLEGVMSRRLYCYDSHSREWNENAFPPMPTARREPITLTTPRCLIVAGGFSGVRALDVVEVMSISEKKWTSCPSPLPHIVYGGTMALCDNQLFLTPFNVESVNTQQMVLACPLSDVNKPVNKKFFKKYAGYWQRLKDLPAPLGSIVAMDGRILAIGGKTSQNSSTKATNSVWEYAQSSGTWSVVSHMKADRWTPIVATLPHDRLLVVGGQAKWKKINSAEVASF